MSVEIYETLGIAGLNTITNALLAYVQIVRVTRSGNVHYEKDGVPVDGEMAFMYEPSAGQIIFDPANPFNGAVVGRPNRNLLEKITVIYKIP